MSPTNYNPQDLDNGWYGALPNATEAGVRKLLKQQFFSGLPNLAEADFIVTFRAETLTGTSQVGPTIVDIQHRSVVSTFDAAWLYNKPSAFYVEFCLRNGFAIDMAKLSRLRDWKVGDEDITPPPPPPASRPYGAPVPHLGPNAFACEPAGYSFPVGHVYEDPGSGRNYVKRQAMFNIWWELLPA